MPDKSYEWRVTGYSKQFVTRKAILTICKNELGKTNEVRMGEQDTVVFTTTWKMNKAGKYTSHVIDIVPELDWLLMISSRNMIEAYVEALVVRSTVTLKYYINFLSVKEFKAAHVNTGTRKYYK